MEYSKKDLVNTSELEEVRLNLQPGEIVEVLQLNEIFQTLDKNRKHFGLYFMPDAERFCGGKYKVYNVIKRIKLEATGEIRKIKHPTVTLEGVFCSGIHHEDCDRSCFHLWREVWLKRVNKE